jgi:hypothetical protein
MERNRPGQVRCAKSVGPNRSDDEEYGAQTVESDEFSITPEDAEEAGHGPFVEYKSALGPNGSMTAVYGLESIDGKASTSISDTTSSRKMLPKYREE